MMKIEGSASESGSGSISQRHGSADPDPHQNFMDPQHWFAHLVVFNFKLGCGVAQLVRGVAQEGCGHQLGRSIPQ
jgi:hypothetical protein